MAIFNTYLNFNGNAEEAFIFYKSVIGGEFGVLMRYQDIPGGDKVAEDVKDKIMHISLPLGNGNILMATDAVASMGHKLLTGNNFYISIYPESKEEAEKMYYGLSAGGKIDQPLEDAFWGAYFGMFTDKFGIQWMVNYEYPKN
ncbi:PhnB protein [Pseudarcicella hirudinis]|uniref:PhnB protein n=1 Tax=Pseudarcicella hirudinis TaxID=1079859 RepID=A0A1I5MSF6_9BACT|nr:VOC family protein [Pseudarcicella hirudinis]SFP12449.1 PhnB protein [Pseudarcicella hirudinis]